VVALLDRILLILMIVEILYTVQVSVREHSLVPEPFLLVGLIATVRRLLVLTAEVSTLGEPGRPLSAARWSNSGCSPLYRGAGRLAADAPPAGP
jgi:phosphate-starvation-inducible protein E